MAVDYTNQDDLMISEPYNTGTPEELAEPVSTPEPTTTATGGGVLSPNYEALANQQAGQATEATTSAVPSYGAGAVAQDISQNVSIGSGDEAVSDKSLVQTQLASILGQDSKLMKQAASRGEVQASRMGQLGSSMGIGAAQGQVIASALPIAQADAATYGKAGLTAQQAQNQLALTQGEGAVAGALAQQEAAIQQRQQHLNNAFQTAIQGLDQDSAAYLQNAQREWDQKLQQQAQEFEEWSTQYQVSAQQKENLMQRRSEALLNHQIAVQELLGDPAFLALEEGGANILNMMASGVISSIRYDMLASGYQESDPAVSAFLDDLAEDLKFAFDDVEF